MSKKNKTKKYSLIFLLGAAGYPALELIYRGRSHWTMSIAGGVCFLIIYIINSHFNKIWIKCPLCAAAITLVEFDIGMIVNYYFHWGVWDYSYLPYNIFGQICPLFSLYWLLLSLPLIFFCDLLDKRLA